MINPVSLSAHGLTPALQRFMHYLGKVPGSHDKVKYITSDCILSGLAMCKRRLNGPTDAIHFHFSNIIENVINM